MLTAALKAAARDGRSKATVLLFDRRVVPPGQAEKSDAIMAQLDHVSGYSIQLFEPYRLSDKRELTIGDTFAIDGAHKIFPTR